jgi:mannobiose 2-epimerase
VAQGFSLRVDRESHAVNPQDLRSAIETEWRDDIRAFWLRHAPDPEFGGFRGRIAHDLRIDPHAEKGVILNARILWTFARAAAVHHDPEARAMADRAWEYLRRHFVDPVHGGVFWTVDHRGAPRDTKKKLYAQAFAIYAFAEYGRSTGEAEPIQEALRLFDLVERHGSDPARGGYGENYERDWTLAGDQRLSDVDLDTRRSMNTHLHVLEAYATLRHVTDDARVAAALEGCLAVFFRHIIDDRSWHLRLFFDEAWVPQSDVISFGHDIEASWLLCEAADALGNPGHQNAARDAAVQMAGTVLQQAMDDDGGLVYEADSSGVIDDTKDWWPQAEAVVGFLNAWEISGDRRFYDAAVRAWTFIDRHVIDRVHGEWHSKLSRAGVPDLSRPKVDLWKCPYHNGRMCFEAVSRLTALST